MCTNLRLVLLGLFAVFSGSYVFAQSKLEQVEVTSTTSKAVILKALFPETLCEEVEKFGARCGGIPPPKRVNVVDSSERTVLFERGKADLTEDAKKLLTKVGEVLADKKDGGKRFVIVGHTDATGTDEINTTLSTQRANAAKDFLIARFSLPPSMLNAKGAGASELLNPLEPASYKNRRVELSPVQ
jgi:outer membrane protein OmpA-like peptidoglycan-associated protein